MTVVEPNDELRAWLRKRIEHEDGLLANRTSIFLVVNGLAAVAVRMEGAPHVALVSVLLTANALWLCCGLQTRCAIGAATTLYFKKKEVGEIVDPADDAVREALKWVPSHCYSTDIFAVWMPLVVLAGWLVGTKLSAT